MAHEQDEEMLRGGAVNPSVVRIGDTVRRTPSEATPAVHDLLRHLEAKGSDGTPRALGFDEVGHEVLTFIHGEVSLDDAGPTCSAKTAASSPSSTSSCGSTTPSRTTRRPTWHKATSRATAIRGPGTSYLARCDPITFIDWDFTTHAKPGLRPVVRRVRDGAAARRRSLSGGRLQGAARSRPTSAARVRDVRQGRDAPDRADRSRRAAPASRHRRDRGAGTLGPRAEKTFGSKASTRTPAACSSGWAPPRAAARLTPAPTPWRRDAPHAQPDEGEQRERHCVARGSTTMPPRTLSAPPVASSHAFDRIDGSVSGAGVNATPGSYMEMVIVENVAWSSRLACCACSASI